MNAGGSHRGNARTPPDVFVRSLRVIARSKATKQSISPPMPLSGLLRFARNDVVRPEVFLGRVSLRSTHPAFHATSSFRESCCTSADVLHKPIAIQAQSLPMLVTHHGW